MPRIDEPTTPPSADQPVVSEMEPGLGRRGVTLEQQRRASGGLDDSSPDNPVRDDNPIRIKK